MDAKAKALAQIEQWNAGGYQQAAPYRYGAYVPRQAPQQKKRSGVVKYLPAIGGAAAGIAAAPFTGGLSLGATIAALGAAGAIGSGVGELGAQAANKERVNLGKAGSEALVGGALSAVPIGGVSRAARVARSATPAVPKGVAGKIADTGRRLETRAGGYGIGEKMTGRAPLTPGTQANIQATLKAERIPRGHPEAQAQAIEAKLKQYGNELDLALAKTNRPLSARARQNIAKEYLAKIEASPTVDDAIRKNAQQFVKNFTTQAKDIKSVNNFRKGVDKNAINYIANPDAATSAKMQAAQVLRQHLSETVSKLSPSVKQLNGKYSKLSEANGYVIQQAGRLTRQGENPGAGISGRLMTGDLAQTAKSKVGGTLQRIPGATPRTNPGLVGPGSGATTEVLKQTLGRGVVGGADEAIDIDPATGQPLEQPDEAFDFQAGMDPYGPEVYDNPDFPTGEAPMPPGMEAPQQPTTLQDALLQAQSILGPSQTPATYLSYAKAIQASNKGTKPSAALEKQQLQVGGVQDVYDQISQAFAEAGGGRGRIPGLVGRYAGTAGLDSKAYNYNQFRDSLVAPLARAISGEVGVLTDADIKRADGLLPKITDSQGEAQNRLRKLQNAISAKKTRLSAPSGGGAVDLESALAQLQGSY